MYASASQEVAKYLSEHTCQSHSCLRSLSGFTVLKHDIAHSSHSHHQLLRTDRTFPTLALWEWLEPPNYSCAMTKISVHRCQVSQAFKSFMSCGLDYSCFIIFQIHLMILCPINSVGGQQFSNEHGGNTINNKWAVGRVQVIIALLIFSSISGLGFFVCVTYDIKYIANGLRVLLLSKPLLYQFKKKGIMTQKGPKKFILPSVQQICI